MASSQSLSQKHYLFQINQHVQASIMLLSIMESAELDLNNTLLSSSSNSDDFEQDLRLAAELGRCLLERNHELQNYIHVLQKQMDDKQSDMKLLHSKFIYIREQFDVKCKQIELLDATNFDLEQELALQRHENEKNRQHIKELFDLCEKTRQQCNDIEHEYGNFRVKQFSSCFQTKSSDPTPIFSTPVSSKRQRSNSFSLKTVSNSPIPLESPVSSNLFDVSSAPVFKTHLSELKLRINSLTIECTTLNDQLYRSEQDKRYLIDRVTQLERQHRDDNDSLQNELNSYRKLFEKYSNDSTKSILSSIYSPPEHDLSLYDEVSLENKQLKSSYEPTNYKDLFARVYEKLKTNDNK
ncbi:unnamed protein product [Adineta steineri]|uniref:Uncharacterized protein n=1 Tax=Adineta steineri TaxID=433720 RepID=A0A819H529_9BILA|nr:unnamed protein product [Adineta steineri]CAF3820149.1 unnamed protein product [Adineta steineri]CAF3894334.1 unnamed protein product [Adineta steineri]